MANVIDLVKLKRGASTNVVAASLERGEPAVSLDTKELWVGDGTGKVKITDVQFYNTLSSFPATGQSNKIYVAKDSAATYLWDPNVLQYKKYELSGSSAIVYCRARMNTVTTFPTSWQDLTYSITDLVSEPTKLYHDGTNQDRIIIKDPGYYRVRYEINYEVISTGTVDCTVSSRIRKNDSNYYDASLDQQRHAVNWVLLGARDTLIGDIVDYFDTDDWVSTQIMVEGASVNVIYSNFQVYKVDSIKGDTGTPGTPGSVWHNGNGVPSVVLGDDNDYYTNNDNGDVYYKQSGSWSLISNIKGPQGDPGNAIPLPVVQARRTTEYSVPNGTWGDISFDTTDLENDDTIIEHDNTNRDRILIKETGLYMIGFHGDIDDEGMIRVRVNDSTVLPGSTRDYGNHADAVDLEGPLANIFFASLNTGDFLTVQIQAASTAEILRVNPIFTVVKMQGPKGDKGDKGDTGDKGEAFQIDEYDNLDEAKITSIESGSGASPSDLYYFLVLDDNRSNQSLPAGISGDMTRHVVMYDGINWYDFGPFTGLQGEPGPQGPAGSGLGEAFQASSDTVQQTTSDSFQQKVRLNATGLTGGTYRIGWYYEWNYNAGSRDFRARVQLDDATDLMEQVQEPKDTGSDQYHPVGGFKYETLSSGDHIIDLDWCCTNLGDTATIRRARLEIWKV